MYVGFRGGENNLPDGGGCCSIALCEGADIQRFLGQSIEIRLDVGVSMLLLSLWLLWMCCHSNNNKYPPPPAGPRPPFKTSMLISFAFVDFGRFIICSLSFFIVAHI